MAYDLKHRTTKSVERGKSFPLGAALTADGVNFALYSKHASEVFLLLFDTPDGEPNDIIRLQNRAQNLTRIKTAKPLIVDNTHIAQLYCRSK